MTGPWNCSSSAGSSTPIKDPLYLPTYGLIWDWKVAFQGRGDAKERFFREVFLHPQPCQGRQVKSEEDGDRFCLFQLGSPTLALFHLAKAALNLSRPVYLTVDVLSLKPNYLLKSIKGEKNPIGI